MSWSLRVAVADENAAMREELCSKVVRLGFEVFAADNGCHLVELCLSQTPDLVLTEVKLANLDGLDAAILINQRRRVPVILLSTCPDERCLTRPGAELVMGFLVKPPGEAALRATISLALLRFQQLLRLAEECTELRHALEDRKLIERAKGVVMKRVRVDEEEAFRRLKKLASVQNRKLIEVAREVVSAEAVFYQMDGHS
jgi:response regulator NasT